MNLKKNNKIQFYNDGIYQEAKVSNLDPFEVYWYSSGVKIYKKIDKENVLLLPYSFKRSEKSLWKWAIFGLVSILLIAEIVFHFFKVLLNFF